MLTWRLFLHALSWAMAFHLGMCNENAEKQSRGDLRGDDHDCGDADLWTGLKRSAVRYSGIIATAVLALAGHLVKSYIHGKNLRMAAEIERLGKQIECFFGPIDGHLRCASSGFAALMDRYRRNFVKENGRPSRHNDQFYVASFFEELGRIETLNGKTDENQEILMMWMAFVKNVALPVNREIRDIIANQTHLYDGSYPECFEQIFDLVAEREMMLQQWENNDYSNLKGHITFPKEADSLVRDELQTKQERKAKLLGLTKAKKVGEGCADRTGGTVAIKPRETKPRDTIFRKYTSESDTQNDYTKL
eukprot:TRINITY_DN11204_c0_g1_i1.p1 TRINITY_DN11204_c0_g1~~TRINITY_DN11204_c0_g1_i1.p1  ORF type:complete len:336 (+),score=29.80 TRINITY_DN11204_c0_g1_i1:91-1008(+)